MIYHSPRPSRWAGFRAVARLLITAVDDLVSALTGTKPVRTQARRVADLLGETYRNGKYGVVDGVEVIHEQGDR